MGLLYCSFNRNDAAIIDIPLPSLWGSYKKGEIYFLMAGIGSPRKLCETLNEVTPVENIKKNSLSFHWTRYWPKEVPPSNKVQDYAYQEQNPFKLREDNHSLTINKSSLTSLSCIKQ